MSIVIELSEINVQIFLVSLVNKLCLIFLEDFQRTDSYGLELFSVVLNSTGIQFLLLLENKSSCFKPTVTCLHANLK